MVIDPTGLPPGTVENFLFAPVEVELKYTVVDPEDMG
jgi:hypothetical protein